MPQKDLFRYKMGGKTFLWRALFLSGKLVWYVKIDPIGSKNKRFKIIIGFFTLLFLTHKSYAMFFDLWPNGVSEEKLKQNRHPLQLISRGVCFLPLFFCTPWSQIVICHCVSNLCAIFQQQNSGAFYPPPKSVKKQVSYIVGKLKTISGDMADLDFLF